jgi:hypothetical protein
VLLGSVIDQDVEPSELTHGVLHDLLAEGLVTHITGHSNTPLACFFHQASSLLRVAVLAQIGDGHIGPFFGESDGHSAADAAIAPGDEGDFAPQFAAASVVLILCLGPRRHLGLDPRLLVLVLRWLSWWWMHLLLSHMPLPAGAALWKRPSPPIVMSPGGCSRLAARDNICPALGAANC